MLVVIGQTEQGILVGHEPATLVPIGTTIGAASSIDFTDIVNIADEQRLGTNPRKLT